MTESKTSYSGLWLHEGERRGKAFDHHEDGFDHAEEGGSSTRLRHAVVNQEGKPVGVWVPAGWSEEQIAEALESNW